MLLRVSTWLSLLALAGCAPEWFSDSNNPPECPVNALPPFVPCPAPGRILCGYTENTGTSRRAPLHRNCACWPEGWVCQYGSPLIDAGSDGGD